MPAGVVSKWRRNDDAALGVAVPVAHSLVRPDHALVSFLDLLVVQLEHVPFDLDFECGSTGCDRLFENTHDVAYLALDHGDTASAMPQSGVGSAQHKKVRKAGDGHSHVGLRSSCLPCLANRPAALSVQLE